MIRWFWQYNKIDNNNDATIRPHQRQIAFMLAKWTCIASIGAITAFFTIFGIDLNPHITLRLATTQTDYGPLISNCFNEMPEQNYHGIIPSVPVIEEHVCYNYSSLIKGTNSNSVIFHTYWKSGTPFYKEHEAVIQSFIATQPSQHKLYVWVSSNDDQVSNYITKKGDRVEIKMISHDLLKNTPLTPTLSPLDDKYLLRLLTLYNYGGVWFDFDVIFVRDLSPLLSQEWLSENHCLRTNSQFQGVFLHFFKHSPFLCEFLSEINTPHKPLVNYGSDLYNRIYYRLLRHKVTTWSTLPWCFTDPSQCKSSNSLPNAFGNTEFDKQRLMQVFAYHWYKPWSFSIHPNSIMSFLINLHNQGG